MCSAYFRHRRAVSCLVRQGCARPILQQCYAPSTFPSYVQITRNQARRPSITTVSDIVFTSVTNYTTTPAVIPPPIPPPTASDAGAGAKQHRKRTRRREGQGETLRAFACADIDEHYNGCGEGTDLAAWVVRFDLPDGNQDSVNGEGRSQRHSNIHFKISVAACRLIVVSSPYWAVTQYGHPRLSG